ncbi:MAG: CPBP family intramembrane metalloprotease [Defluviitaleaceae bacterium]|nr:CPBP family intramembrane metalloprotease [Defluviitaleaceae bacterium]
MLHIILLVSLVIFFTVGAVLGVKQTKKQLKANIDEKARVQHYAAITFSMWIPVIALFGVVAFSDITFADIGFTSLSFNQNAAITLVILVLAFLWTAFCLYRITAFLVSAKHRQRRNKILLNKANGSDYYDLVDSRLMTPRTKKEKRWWFGVSLTTGICEEIIFRGVFLYLIASIFPNISVYLVFMIAVILFGMGHFYQGTKGLIITTLMGAFLASIYIVSGSLIIVIVMHFLTNFANAFEYSDKK